MHQLDIVVAVNFSLISQVQSTLFSAVKTEEKMLYNRTVVFVRSTVLRVIFACIKMPYHKGFEVSRYYDEMFGVIEYLNFITRFRVRTFQFSSGIPRKIFS